MRTGMAVGWTAVAVFLAFGGLVLAAPMTPPYYIGEVLPTPKQAIYFDDFLELYDVEAGRPLATIVIDEDGPPAQGLAAEELSLRVLDVAYGEERVPLVQWGTARSGVAQYESSHTHEGLPISVTAPDQGPVIRLTSRSEAWASEHGDDTAETLGDQGYTVRSVSDSGREMVVGGAPQPLGVYYAAQSLKQLLTVQDGKVFLQRADILDYPTFQFRAAICPDLPMAEWIGFCKYGVLEGLGTLAPGIAGSGKNMWRQFGVSSNAGWGWHCGHGGCRPRMTRDNPHGGEWCVWFEITKLYNWEDRPPSVGCQLLLGQSFGDDGANALFGRPGRYHLTFWLRGGPASVLKVTVAVMGWTTEEAKGAGPPLRIGFRTDLEPFAPTPEWRCYEASFQLGEEVKRFAITFTVLGAERDGYRVGQSFAVDDVVLVREGSNVNLAVNGDCEGIVACEQAMGGNWAVPRGLTFAHRLNPLNVEGWEDGGEDKIRCSSAEDIELLAKRFRVALDGGCTYAHLTLDDFTSKVRFPERPYYVLTQEADKEAFRSLGEAHGTLVRELYLRLKLTHPRCRLWVCPAYYHNHNKIREDGPPEYIAHQEEYLREFGELVPPDVLIDWTGSGMGSRHITPEDVDYFAGLIGRKPLYWDNTWTGTFPFYQPSHPWEREYPERFWEMVPGALLNYGTSHHNWRYPVCRVDQLRYADYLWRPETHDEGESCRKAAAMVAGPEAADAYLRFREARLHLFWTCSQLWQQAGRPEEAYLLKALGWSAPARREVYTELAQRTANLDRDELLKALGSPYPSALHTIKDRSLQVAGALEVIKAMSPNADLVEALEGLAVPVLPIVEKL